jgi:hypothetical protein
VAQRTRSAPAPDAKFLQVEAAMKARIARELAEAVAIEQKKLLKERQRLDADRSKMKQQFDKQLKTAVAEVRQILQKDRDAALAKREAGFSREREALQKKVVEISRRAVKSSGERIRFDPRTAIPKVEMLPMSYLDLEAKALYQLKKFLSAEVVRR